ncbi:unnamed protein product [Linum trigynum]|uniref:Uncharacterized protein n=2 Tax=Linum trigynum TaxID=586398 RepID=A0AAV2FU91_9ROSI
MATKKVGRQIYDEDDQSMTAGGSRSSVWVNRQKPGRETETGPKPSTVNEELDRAHPANKLRAQNDGPTSKSLGREDRAVDEMLAHRELERSPARRHSPKGFAMNRPPKLQIGGKGGKQKRKGMIKEMAKPGARGKLGGEGYHTQQPSRLKPHPSAVEMQAETVEASRRRRLILEDDSDDDMIAPSRITACESPIQPSNELVPPVVSAKDLAPIPDIPKQGKKLRLRRRTQRQWKSRL